MIHSLTHTLIEPEEESRLLARAAVDPAAFGELYRVYLKPVYRYLYYRVGNHMDAEDITALVFTQAFECIGRYRHDGRFMAWLMTIARRRANDFFRRRRPLVSMEFVETLLIDAGQGSPENQHADRIRALAKTIESMNEEEKELLRLRFTTDLSFQEVAAVLNCPEETVKKRFYRLLERIRHTVEGE